MISEETKKKMEQVASVCIRCRRCMKECIMLNRFAQNPKVLFAEYLEKGPENMDRSIAYSCNECSQCTLKCPKGLNLKAVFQSLKEDYAAENAGIVPVDALLPSELGQNKECAPQYCTTLDAGTGSRRPHRARYLFVPGKFPPAPILKHLRQSLGEYNVAVLPFRVLDAVTPEILKELGGSEDQILISACPSSFRSLKEAVPHRRVLFYWDLMHDLIGMPEDRAKEDTDLLLRSGDGIGDSVRWVIDQLGCETQQAPQKDSLDPDRDCRQVLGLLFGVSNGQTALG